MLEQAVEEPREPVPVLICVIVDRRIRLRDVRALPDRVAVHVNLQGVPPSRIALLKDAKVMSHYLNLFLNRLVSPKAVIPAKAGIQNFLKTLDSRLHGNDE